MIRINHDIRLDQQLFSSGEQLSKSTGEQLD